MLEEIDLTPEGGAGHSLADPGPFEGSPALEGAPT